MPLTTFTGCCGAARSTLTTASCGVPIATGSARSFRAGSSAFGWWCAHAVEALDSIPLVAFRGTHGSGRQSGQSRQYRLLSKSQGLGLSLVGVCERFGFGGQATILPDRSHSYPRVSFIVDDQN